MDWSGEPDFVIVFFPYLSSGVIMSGQRRDILRVDGQRRVERCVWMIRNGIDPGHGLIRWTGFCTAVFTKFFVIIWCIFSRVPTDCEPTNFVRLWFTRYGVFCQIFVVDFEPRFLPVFYQIFSDHLGDCGGVNGATWECKGKVQHVIEYNIVYLENYGVIQKISTW